MRGPSGHARRLLGAAALGLAAAGLLGPPAVRPGAIVLAALTAFAFGRATTARPARRPPTFTDRLTGLRTGDSFSEALGTELARVRRYGGCVTLVLLGIDGLETNRLLASVGRVLAREKRDPDIAARVGPAEFALLVPGRGEQAAVAAERLRHAITDIPGVPDSIAVAAGLATFPVHARDADELLEQAEEALAEARRRGRGRVVCAEGVQPRAQVAG